MVMDWFLSVVIDIINILRAVFKAENHPPVGANGHSPKALHLAFKRIQPQPRLVQMSNGRGGMKGRQNIPQRLGMFQDLPPWGRPVQRAVSGPCGGLSVSSRTATCNGAHVKNNFSSLAGFLRWLREASDERAARF
jgi:hypothetical protein